MAKDLLDEIGEQIFTTGKMRKPLDKLFIDSSNTLLRLIRSTIGDDSIKPTQVKKALKRLWTQTSEDEVAPTYRIGVEPVPRKTKVRGKEYTKEYHLKGKPQELIELFRTIDKFCREPDPTAVRRKYFAKYVRYTHLQKSGLRVWLKLNYSDLESPPEYVCDVLNIGHWGVGDAELAIDSIQRFGVPKVDTKII